MCDQASHHCGQLGNWNRAQCLRGVGESCGIHVTTPTATRFWLRAAIGKSVQLISKKSLVMSLTRVSFSHVQGGDESCFRRLW